MCGALIAFVVAKQRSRLKRQIWDSFVATFDFLVGHLVRLHDFPCSGLVEFQREKEIAAESGFCLPTHLRERSVNDKRASVDPSVWFDRVPEQPEPTGFFGHAFAFQLGGLFCKDAFLDFVFVAWRLEHDPFFAAELVKRSLMGASLTPVKRESF